MAKMSKEQFVAKMAAAKAAKKMAAAMAEATVSAAALEIATKSEEEMAKMESTKMTATNGGTDKAAAKAKKIEKWLAKAKLDENGKYHIVAEYDYKGYAENAGWKPCYYIVTTEFTLTRIGAAFAVELAEQGKAIEITKEQVKASKKTTRKAQAQPVEQDDDSSFDEVLDLIPTWQDFDSELVG